MSPQVTGNRAVHVINHTHWDREWFLTAEYTTAWIPELIDALVELREANPGYQYLFDGQSLAIEDLLALDPSYRDTVGELVSSGALGIGPQYSQPDWRITSGELLARNLAHGMSDLAAHGGSTNIAWMVDTFGHISQAPQLMRQAGLTTAYVWRGVPQLAPLLRWQAPDGSEVAAVNLFGGYRNLYGITRTPDLAIRRLEAEVAKLSPHYGDFPIPLFDGYDLETEPEDPIRFYRRGGGEVPEGIDLIESSPQMYAEAIEHFTESAPIAAGEMISGKFGATFPGTLSSRTYLKVLQSDCEHWVHAVAEPLAALLGQGYPTERFEAWDRELLQNAVHDCICGVSIDPVHERMERSYRRLRDEAEQQADSTIRELASGLRNGRYVVATSPVPTSHSVRVGAEVWSSHTDGLGFWPTLVSPVTEVDTDAVGFEFASGAGRVSVDADGVVHIGDAKIARVVVRRDEGDTYSSEPGAELAVSRAHETRVESRSATDVIVRIEGTAIWDGGSVETTLRVRASESQTVELGLEIDSAGTGFIAELEIHTGIQGATQAGMPFDDVSRPNHDADLLGTTLDDGLGRVLMGQREVHQVETFPFHDHVAVSSETETAVVHARGIRSYRSTSSGVVYLTLRRSVEWLAKSGLEYRAGDAGPAMYVPGARCERRVEHHLGLSILRDGGSSSERVEVCERFKHPVIPLTVENSQSQAALLAGPAESLPMSSLVLEGGSLLGRFHNPTSAPVSVADQQVEPGEIAQIAQVGFKHPHAPDVDATVNVHWNAPFDDRAGRSRSIPDIRILDELDTRIASLNDELQRLNEALDGLSGDAYHRQLHRIFVIERESLELQLSVELNRRRHADPTAEVSIPDEPDKIISALGGRLNDLRIHRRIYDYVAEILDEPAAV